MQRVAALEQSSAPRPSRSRAPLQARAGWVVGLSYHTEHNVGGNSDAVRVRRFAELAYRDTLELREAALGPVFLAALHAAELDFLRFYLAELQSW